MKLQDKLNAMKKENMASRPPEVVKVLLQEVENLVKAGIADKAIKSGEPLPEFILPDEKGHPVSSKELLDNGPLAISFYRGVW